MEASILRQIKLLSVIFLFALSSCSGSEENIPAPVFNTVKEDNFGEENVVKDNLREGLSIIENRYKENYKLSDITIDYMNINSGTISFNENWPTSIGIGYLHIVSFYYYKNNITLSSVDKNGNCWYIEIKEKNKSLSKKYGLSEDSSCKASSRIDFEIKWDKLEFPLNSFIAETLSN